MRQFRTILRFELANYYKNKIFVGITLFLVAAIVLVMFFPRLRALIGGETPSPSEKEVLLLSAEADGAALLPAFAAAFPDYDVQLFSGVPDQLRHMVQEGTAGCAVMLSSLTSYTYYINNLSIYDQNTVIIDAILVNYYRLTAMAEAGLTPDRAGEILSKQIDHHTENLGKDQTQNFLYTYIMIFALYMVIMLYGQMVATNVASEKSSRAMELLITSVRPTAMMFGKVIAACLAGFAQLLCVFGAAFVCFNLNRAQWADNALVCSVFNMPAELVGYLLLYFVLGFFIYAFLYGAIGSTATKLEDVNTSVMPISMLFILAFCIVVGSMTSGKVDNTAMLICSFVPFTSPMAMFARIAMSVVPAWQVALSVAILLLSTFGIGVLSAKIYRVGVLLYGNRPKLRELLRAIGKA